MIGDKIKELRKSKGWTQAQLATMLNVTQSAIGKWEGKSKSTPADDVKIRLAELFGVSLEYLIGDVGATESVGEDQLEKDLLVYYRMLNDSGRQLVLDYAQMLSAKDSYKREKDTLAYA